MLSPVNKFMNPCGFRVYFRTGQNGPDKQKKGEFTMKKTITKLMAALAVIILTLTAAPAADAQAAPRLNKANLTLYTGQTKTLKLRGASRKTAVKWSVAKKSVATVTKNGKVKAKKAGRTSVYAETRKVICVCTVTVKKPALSTKKLTLEEGETAQLALKGAKIRKCVSDNTAVAAVDGTGRVTAGEAGTATVTVTDTKGRKYRCTAEVTADAQADDSTVQDTENAAPAAGETGNNTAGSTGTAGNAGTQTAVAPGHQHTWAPHYTYVADGVAYVDCSFCTDVTCPENKGFGTDNGLRKPVGTTRPVGPQTGNTGSTGNSGSGNTGSTQTQPQAPSVTVPDSSSTDNSSTPDDTQVTVPSDSAVEAQPQAPSQDAHVHAWVNPVYSGDGTQVTGYTCDCGQQASHIHEWTEAVTGTEGIMAGVRTGYRCACGEEISQENYDRLVTANREASDKIMQAWIAKNITAGMSELDKVKAVLAEIQGWTYAADFPAYAPSNVSRKGDCITGNTAFGKYCSAAGIQTEIFFAGDMVNAGNHYMSYVWIDGEKCVVDATPIGTINIIVYTEEGFNLYCSWVHGDVTNEEYAAQIDQYLR